MSGEALLTPENRRRKDSWIGTEIQEDKDLSAELKKRLRSWYNLAWTNAEFSRLYLLAERLIKDEHRQAEAKRETQRPARLERSCCAE